MAKCCLCVCVCFGFQFHVIAAKWLVSWPVCGFFVSFFLLNTHSLNVFTWITFIYLLKICCCCYYFHTYFTALLLLHTHTRELIVVLVIDDLIIIMLLWFVVVVLCVAGGIICFNLCFFRAKLIFWVETKWKFALDLLLLLLFSFVSFVVVFFYQTFVLHTHTERNQNVLDDLAPLRLHNLHTTVFTLLLRWYHIIPTECSELRLHVKYLKKKKHFFSYFLLIDCHN